MRSLFNTWAIALAGPAAAISCFPGDPNLNSCLTRLNSTSPSVASSITATDHPLRSLLSTSPIKKMAVIVTSIDSTSLLWTSPTGQATVTQTVTTTNSASYLSTLSTVVKSTLTSPLKPCLHGPPCFSHSPPYYAGSSSTSSVKAQSTSSPPPPPPPPEAKVNCLDVHEKVLERWLRMECNKKMSFLFMEVPTCIFDKNCKCDEPTKWDYCSHDGKCVRKCLKDKDRNLEDGPAG